MCTGNITILSEKYVQVKSTKYTVKNGSRALPWKRKKYKDLGDK